MKRTIHKLSARVVDTIARPGRHSDGGGLYLVVDKSGARRWAFLFRWKGRLKEMGLGGKDGVPLAKAREIAASSRADLAAGRNPIEARRAGRSRNQSFGEFADAYVADQSPHWKNKKHKQQWVMTLRTYAEPLRSKGISDIGIEDVLAVLQPIWLAKAETASRLRGRIEQVLDAATVKGLRTGANPAAWRGNLDKLLKARPTASRGHHKAMSYAEVPEFMAALRTRNSDTARALEFVVLTAVRTNEALGARWSEINFSTKVWTLPKERMKAGREHRVPLSDRALEILEEARKHGSNEFVFPGQKRGKSLSSGSLRLLLDRMKIKNGTVHGFRSAFRDWCGDATSFPREVAEAALAHAVGDETEQAYRRGDALEKRRKLMDAWARFCTTKPANVVPFVKSGGGS
jgi:integrase